MRDDPSPQPPTWPPESAEALQEWLALYALNALDAGDRARVERRLASDAEARAMLSQMQPAIDALATASPAVEPAARARERLIARVDAEMRSAEMAARRQQPGPRARVLAMLRAAAPLVAVGALIAACGLGAWALSMQGQLARAQQEAALLQSADLRIASLPNAPGAPAGAQVAFLSAPESASGILTARGLAPLAPGKTYQFWLLRGGQATPAGTFDVDAAGAGRLWVHADQPIGAFNQAGVTIEPAGGSAAPTLDALVSFGNLD